MSKIICEICGTVYPDNATTCPICGYPRSMGENEEMQEEEVAASVSQATTRVRGGRFSNSNVKKRNQTAQNEEHSRAQRVPEIEQEEPEEDDYEEPRPKSGRGLMIVLVILLLAVIFVGAYIGIRFFRGADAYDNTTSTTPPTTEVTNAPTEDTVPEETVVACTEIQMGNIDPYLGVEFPAGGRVWQQDVTLVPTDTTEELTISISDPFIADVSIDNGRVQIVALSEGTATVTVSCGSVSVSFPVNCNFGTSTEATEESTDPSDSTEETTEPTTEATTEPTETTSGSGSFKLNRTDVTCTKKGETFTISAGVSSSQVTWSSSDTGIATVENGKVTAVGKGTATITASYNGKTQTCIVRCNLPDDAGTGNTGNYTLSNTDVTIKVGEKFDLTLKNGSGETVRVSWSGGSGVSISGNTITGVTAGDYTVSCTHEGQTYSCIVRVK